VAPWIAFITSRTQHAGQVTLTIGSTHGMRDKARGAYVGLLAFWQAAEQLDPLAMGYRIL
jgi:hypothetical protein